MALFLTNQEQTFFHFPKTGGLWFRKVLDELKIEYQQIGNQHDTPTRPKRLPFNEENSFCFIRKPSEWILSYWRYRMAGDLGRVESWIEYHPCWSVDDLLVRNFDLFVELLEERDYEPVKRIYKDFLGCRWVPFDDLQSFTSEILGVSLSEVEKISPFNVSNKIEVSDYSKAKLYELDGWIEL